MSYRDEYYFQREKEYEAAGDLELRGRINSCLKILNKTQPNKFRRFYHTTAFSYVLTAFLSTATVASGYYAYQEFPVVRKTLIAIGELFKPDYSKKTGQFMVARGNALRSKYQFKEAEDAYRIAIEKFTYKENWQGLGNVHTELGVLRTRNWKYKDAKKQFQKALSYFGWAGDNDGRGYANINMAQLYLLRRHFFLARKYFLAAKEHYKASNNDEGLGNVVLGLGNLYIAKKDYRRAKEHFTEAESKFQLIGNRRGLVNVYNSIAHAFEVLRTKRGEEEAAIYRRLAKSIKLDTQTRDLPSFSIQESFAWLTKAFDQHKDIYEVELNGHATEETERVLR